MKKIHSLGLLIFTGILFSRIGGFIFRALALKFLPLSLYGELAIFILLMNFFGLIASLGLPVLITSFAGKESSEKKRFKNLQEFSSILLPFSILTSLLLLAFSPLISSTLNISIKTIVFLSGILPVYTFYNLLLFYFRGTNAKISTISEFLFSAFRIIAFIILFLLGFVFLSPFLAFLLAFFLSAFFMFLNLKNKNLFIKFSKVNNARKIIAVGSIVVAYEAIRNFSLGMDRFMLSSFFSTKAAGIYDSLVLLCIFYVVLANSYGIALLSQKSKMKEKLKHALSAYFKISLAYAIFIFSVNKPILAFFKPEVLKNIQAFPYVLLGYLIYGIFIIFIFFFTSVKRYKIALNGTIIFLFLNAILNLYLVPQLKYLGAGISLLLSLTISTIFLGVKIWRKEY